MNRRFQLKQQTSQRRRSLNQEWNRKLLQSQQHHWQNQNQQHLKREKENRTWNRNPSQMLNPEHHLQR